MGCKKHGKSPAHLQTPHQQFQMTIRKFPDLNLFLTKPKLSAARNSWQQSKWNMMKMYIMDPVEECMACNPTQYRLKNNQNNKNQTPCHYANSYCQHWSPLHLDWLAGCPLYIQPTCGVTFMGNIHIQLQRMHNPLPDADLVWMSGTKQNCDHTVSVHIFRTACAAVFRLLLTAGLSQSSKASLGRSEHMTGYRTRQSCHHILFHPSSIICQLPPYHAIVCEFGSS